MGDRVSERNGRTPEEVRAENADVTDFLNVPPSTPRSRRNLYSNDAHAAHVAGLIKTPAKLRRDVTKAVRSPDLMDVEHYQTKGRFDARSFVRVDAGAVNVFRRRSEALGQTAAVSLLIDLSTSMRGDRINMATCLALHLGDALKAAGVPFEIAGFTCRTSTNVAADGILVTKGFRDSWHDARTATAGLTNAVQGGTAMLPGIKAMVARLKARAGVSRRILLVLTDGQDGYSTGSDKAAVRAALADGVEVVGIGMLHDASPAFGPAYLTVTSLATVATAGLSSLVNVLREDGPRKRAA
jgi:cobalamin biosynthesis protein CobT